MIESAFYLILIACAVMFMKLSPKEFRFDLKAFSKLSLTILFGLTISYLAILSISDLHSYLSYSLVHDTLVNMASTEKSTAYLSVWWEDVFFLWPAILFASYFGNRAGLIVLAPFSVLFMMGHLYQGPSGYLSIVYPWISFYLAKKHGALTMAGAHVVYDLSVTVAAWAALSIYVNA